MARRYRIGYEWPNARGQIFVYLPDHVRARKDGFIPRSHLVMEELLGRPLEKGERVLHIDENPGNDEPENLKLFGSQKELAVHRSNLYHEGRQNSPNPTYQKLVAAAKELRERRKEDKEYEQDQAKPSPRRGRKPSIKSG